MGWEIGTTPFGEWLPPSGANNWTQNGQFIPFFHKPDLAKKISKLKYDIDIFFFFIIINLINIIPYNTTNVILKLKSNLSGDYEINPLNCKEGNIKNSHKIMQNLNEIYPNIKINCDYNNKDLDVHISTSLFVVVFWDLLCFASQY